MIKSVTF